MYIEEEITLFELAERFLNIDDFSIPCVIDMQDLDIWVETEIGGDNCFVPIKSFVIKDRVHSYYFDGKLKASYGHVVIEDGNEIRVDEHSEFHCCDGEMDVVDIEVDSECHSYLANGRLNHNTTSGGKSLGFHSSVRIRLDNLGKIKANIKGVDEIIGAKTKAKVFKNRLGPPHRECEYEVHFNSGINDVSGLIKTAKTYGIFKTAGGYTKWMDKVTGEEITFQGIDGFKESILSNPDVYDHFYGELSQCLIREYIEHTGEIEEIDEVIEE